MSRQVLLTVDYEIFGNGSGDVRRHIIAPAEQLAQACERHGVPLTVFVETEELFAFERHDAQLATALGYRPARLIRDQIRSLAARGHDIQLHLHPEWVGCSYRDGRWQLRSDKCTVDSLFETAEETDRYISERKAFLESISGETVVAYRAGAFCAQPGIRLLRALAASGIAIESSVVKGMVRHARHGSIDYRDAPQDKPFWRVTTDVAIDDASGIICEVPIYSVMRRRLHQATFSRLRAKFSRHVPKDRQYEMLDDLGLKSMNPLKLIEFLRQNVPVKFDFHNVSPSKLLKWIRSAPQSGDEDPDVIVLIGHTKEHLANKPFERLLSGIASSPDLKVVGYRDLAAILAQPPTRKPMDVEAVGKPFLDASKSAASLTG